MLIDIGKFVKLDRVECSYKAVRASRAGHGFMIWQGVIFSIKIAMLTIMQIISGGQSLRKRQINIKTEMADVFFPGNKPAGTYTYIWNARNNYGGELSSGIIF